MSSDISAKRGRERFRQAWLLAVWFAVHNASRACADIAPAPLSGGKSLEIKGNAKTNVAMVDEVVKLKLSRDACHVDVVFTMKNTDAKYETMQVGFPHYYPDELKDFKAAVNDKPVVVKTAAESETTSSPDFPEIKGQRRIYWKTWEMTFAPEAPVKIAVSYSTKLRKGSTIWREGSTWMVDMNSISNHLTELAAKDDQPALQKQLVSGDVTYILRSGSHWSGPIGRCRIEVTFDGMTTDNLTLGSPHFEQAAATITRDKITWDLKDYEPKQDVYLTFTPEITRAATLKLLERFQKQHPHDPGISGVLFEYLIAAKRQPEADALMLELLKHWQDKIAIWGPESERGQSLRHSAEVFSMIHRRIDKERKPLEFQNPSQLAPVIERIALRVQDQLKFVPPNQADRTKHYVEQIDKMLEWSKTHAKPE